MKDKTLALNVLKTEEKQLLKIASDLQDYLTRLKVNELTLLSLMKSKTIEQEERNILPCTSRSERSMDQVSSPIDEIFPNQVEFCNQYF